MPWHHGERTALADALEAAGPGAPTRCDGWLTEHLAAHVVLREGDPLAAAGLAGGPLAGRTARRTRAVGDAAAGGGGYGELVDRVRRGPPPWSPLRWAGDGGQLTELYVHTEDVRRGAGRDGVHPRSLPDGEREVLWALLRRTAPLLYRDSPVGVVLAWGSRDLRARRPGADPLLDVVVRGDVGELVLHAWGRSDVALVDVVGSAGPVARLDRVRPR